MTSTDVRHPGGPRRSRRAATSWFAGLAVAAALTLSACATTDTATTAATAATETSTAASTSAATTTTAFSSSAGADTTGAVESGAIGSSTTAITTAESISQTTAAATAFLATLSDEQREQVLYAYDDETKTTSWSNFPVTFVERAGLNLHDLTDEQQTAAMAVLEALLSDEGYATVTGIIDGDQYLLDNSSSTEASLGQYSIAFFGDPSDSSAYELQFGGHHLGINATLNGTDSTITFAPTHLGSQPAVYTDGNGVEVQPLAGMYETAFAFYDSLTAEQQAQLYQGSTVATMVCAPGGTCDYPTGTGLSGADLTDEQEQLLLAVITNWVGLSDQETTTTALAEIEATLDETFVNWSGATVYDMASGDGIYFQISGPKVYIEFASQQGSAGADVDGVVTAGWGHIHTIYRDPTNDYAGSATQQAAAGPGGGAGGPGGGAGGQMPPIGTTTG